MSLIEDIRAFEVLEPSRRKWVLSQLFDLRRIIEHDFKEEPHKIADFEVALRALDALHHLAKDGVLVSNSSESEEK